jgi:SNF2 family DNA or RNA helicase
VTVYAERDGDEITLRASVTDNPRVKEIPGARFDRRSRSWHTHLSWAACQQLRGVFGAELEVGPELTKWAVEEFNNRVQQALEAKGGGLDYTFLTPAPLYPYQQDGVRFLRAASSALLADEMGTGKTIQAAVVLDELPAIVICPNSVKSVWRRELAKWRPDLRTVVSTGGTAALRKAADKVSAGEADVLITNWESVKSGSRLAPYGNARLLSCEHCDETSNRKAHLCEREPKFLNEIAWQTVIVDEAHRGKDPRAKQTRAAWALGDRAEHRFALTGTPIADSPEDLWSVMRFVAPAEYPSKTAWLSRYAQMVPNIWSGFPEPKGFRADHREEFDRFFLPRFMRRLKAQVLPDLPPKTYMRREVQLSGKQLKAYQSMRDDMIAQLDDGTLAETSVMTAALRLRQFASAYATIDGEHVRLSEPSSKLDEMEAVLEELGDRQAVIFAESKQLIYLARERISRRTDRVVTLTGDDSTDARAVALEAFRAGDARYILVTLGAGGEGVDGLQAADTAIFLQRPWSAVLNKQAEDRLHRIGQEAENVTYIDIVATGTVDERVFDVLQDKAEMLEDLVHDRDVMREWLL